MVLDSAVAFSVEVEICVVGEVHHCILISLGGKGEFEGAVVCPLIMRHGLEGSGISFLSVL